MNGEGTPPYGTAVTLRNDEGFVRRTQMEPRVVLDPKNVRVLNPAEGLPVTINLNELYGKLKPGRYTAHIQVELTGKTMNLSPLFISHDVIVDVTAER